MGEYAVVTVFVVFVAANLVSAEHHVLVKRGIPVSGTSSDAQAASNAYANQAGSEAVNQLNSNERVAQWAASSAVGQAVGRDYANQRATTAQFVAQFTVPVTKEQAGRVFNTIAGQQKSGDISSALASNNNAIHYAALQAANSNYQQALQSQNAGYGRTGGGHGGGGGGGYGGGSGGGWD